MISNETNSGAPAPLDSPAPATPAETSPSATPSPSAPLFPKVIQGQEDECEGDLCDTCMCSGVEISHTEGGKTVCVECAAGGSDLAPQEVPN